jgi:hypothetical protein
MEFGFLTRDLDIADGDFAIRTIGDWRTARADLEAGGHVVNGWFYMPRKLNSPEPAGRYQLPITHDLQSAKYSDPDLQRFVVIVLGFLLGLRLLPEGWGHLHGAAIEVGKCNGFNLFDREIIPCLERAAVFQIANANGRNVKRLESAISLIHWSKGQEQHFDTFSYLYSAIDACWAAFANLHAGSIAQLKPKRGVSHAERPVIMQQVLRLKLPRIFDPTSAVTAASIRNDLIHEGMVGDMPLGLSFIDPHCDLEMREFADKLILALLGVSAHYLDTPGGDRSRHVLGLR